MTASTTDPGMVLKGFMDAFITMDFDRALSYVAEDCEYTNIPLGTVRGHAGIREVLEPFFAPIHENEFQMLRYAAAGPVVFSERLDRHRLDHRRPGPNRPPCDRAADR